MLRKDNNSVYYYTRDNLSIIVLFIGIVVELIDTGGLPPDAKCIV